MGDDVGMGDVCNTLKELPVFNALFPESWADDEVRFLQAVTGGLFCLFVLVFLALVWCKRQKLRQGRAVSSGFLLPIYWNFLWFVLTVTAIETVCLIVHTLVDDDVSPRQDYNGSAITLYYAFLVLAPQYLRANGIVFFLMQRNRGKVAINRAIWSSGIVYALLGGLFASALYQEAPTHSYIYLAAFFCQLALLLGVAYHIAMARSAGALGPAAPFCSNMMLMMWLVLMEGVRIFAEFLYIYDGTGCCMELFERYLTCALTPWLILYTLRVDSKYWQNLGELLKSATRKHASTAFKDTTPLQRQDSERTMKELMNSESVLIDPQYVYFGKQIDHGAFSRVYRGVLAVPGKTHQDVAIKKIVLDELTTSVIVSFCKEALISTQLKHRNVIHMSGVCVSPPSLLLLFEYCTCKSLYNELQGDNPLPWTTRLLFLKDVVAGMSYLHKQRVIHRDLKSDNCLLTKDENGLTVKICDFGTSRVLSHKPRFYSNLSEDLELAHQTFQENHKLTTLIGTPTHIPPEVISGIKGKRTHSLYGLPFDVFSFGCLLWEIITREQIWQGKFIYQIYEKVMHGQRPTIPEDCLAAEGCPALLLQLLQKCWKANPLERPTFEEIRPLLIRASLSGSPSISKEGHL